MKTETFKSEITVQKYEYGKPFPGLYGQFDGMPKLPESAQVKVQGAMGDYFIGQGGMAAKFGIVLTERDGFVFVMDGEYLEVAYTPNDDQYHQSRCLGKVSKGYSRS